MTKAVRRLAIILLIAATAAVRPAAAAAPAAAEPKAAVDFVNAVAHDVIATFGGKTLTRAERARLFRATILRYAEPRPVAEAVLGSYWRSMTEAERTQFQDLLVDYVVAAWSESLSSVSAATRVEVRGTASAGERTVVRTVVSEPGDEPSVVDWTVDVPAGGGAFLVDITAGGVSVVKTMRADFGSVLRANGGRLAALTDALRRKIAQFTS